ncbi:fumarylacetoacetate hydrolase family protein [Erythrobacter sp. WG]|uniref:fumarylacetoacetate hydrolase family protein n=1 Tax=Erythrobacter sp. WG TaxID=2985510 RepID=UPI00226FD6CC|nr:fumarylacetoacetate hydrolase family protein [Erythrobacter sp. WG]MCX9148498.1 fumarylacetoacetate hydrolase family protein [Erythrobacter sp. WG]
MRIARIEGPQGPELAVVAADERTWQRTGVAAPGNWLAPGVCERVAAAAAGMPREPLDPALLLPPVAARCIVGVGLNYRAHTAEQGKALPEAPPLFLKHPRSLAPPFGTLPLHPASHRLDYEAELGIVIGHPVFDCTPDEAAAAIAGWVVMQDYTLRDLARPETLTIAKGGPGMAPIGPWLTTVESIPLAAASALTITCRVNGELRQHAGTTDMHIGPAALVHHVARHLPLGPGDVIATGSPSGSGVGMNPPRWLAAGDVVETAITGLGTIRQRVTGPS